MYLDLEVGSTTAPICTGTRRIDGWLGEVTKGGRPTRRCKSGSKGPRLPMKIYAAVIVTVALGVVAPSAASAQTPAGYRAQLNGLCRSYTPKFRADRKAMQGDQGQRLEGLRLRAGSPARARAGRGQAN